VPETPRFRAINNTFRTVMHQTAEVEYVPSSVLAGKLHLSENQINRLGRDGIFSRIPDPNDSRSFLYPLWTNILEYVDYLRSPAERAKEKFIREKTRVQTATLQKLKLEVLIKSGKAVDRDKVLRELETHFVLFKRRLTTLPARVSGMFAENEEDRKALQDFLDVEVADALSLLVSIVTAGTDNGSYGALTQSEHDAKPVK
jgi:hypothetical protein